MARKWHTAEEIVAKLRQVDALMAQGKRLKEVETENSRLRKAISDLTLDKQILQQAAKGNF